ncbi:MAG: DUF2232 domain-containing protein [Bdellovibrionales bacterium]|nr:DUF2232 domain-containing protein [Bdellovibrionales bacterium]
MRGLARIAPFLMSAVFYNSSIFLFISPLPLFILTLRNHLWISLLALVTNLALLSMTTDSVEMYVAGALWVGVGILFPLTIRKLGKIHQSFGLSFLFLVGLMVAGVYFQAHHVQQGMLDYVRAQVSIRMDQLLSFPDSPFKQFVEEQGKDELLRKVMTEVPATILALIVFCLWLNLLFASQLVKGFLSKTFWASYRNPEWLVFPTLICGGLYVFTDHAPYYIGLNGLKVFMVFYAMQGLSIISHLLNRYKILGIGRIIVFSVAILIAPPFVLALGFFDLWFDFRKKFGHS